MSHHDRFESLRARLFALITIGDPTFFIIGRCKADHVPAVVDRPDRLGAIYVDTLHIADADTVIDLEKRLVEFAKAVWPERNGNDHIGGGHTGDRVGPYAIFIAHYPFHNAVAA